MPKKTAASSIRMMRETADFVRQNPKATPEEIDAKLASIANEGFAEFIPQMGAIYKITECDCVGGTHKWSTPEELQLETDSHVGCILLGALMRAGGYHGRFYETLYLFRSSVVQTDGTTKSCLLEQVAYSKFMLHHKVQVIGNWITDSVIQREFDKLTSRVKKVKKGRP